MESTADRLGNCEVCAANAAKYTCPKCEVKTCTLKCVNIHKKELECDGIRDKVRYVPMSKFTNLDLLSDYRLLEDIGRTVDTLKKDKSKRYTRINRDLPRHLQALKRGLLERKTTIQFLPANFKRHQLNSSQINFKSLIVYWHIEWVFPQADDLKLYDERCDENLKISHIIHKYLDPKLYPNDKLKFYQSSGLSSLNFYLKAENKSGDKYYDLDPDYTLKQCFANKTIIEFPTIYVAFKNHCDMFDVISTDDEDGMETNAANASSYISAIVKAEEKETTTKKGNLLFFTEYSDEDEMLSD